MKTINQYQRAMQAWDVLIQVAERGNFIRYKELGDKIGIHHRTVRFVLAIIQEYCSISNLPPLTILVGNKLGTPGKGFIAWDSSNFKEGKKKVYNHNWKEEPNPFSFASDGTSEEKLIKMLLKNPQDSDEVYRKIKSRGTSQIIFRKALLEAYNSRCSFCNISIKSILQAAHIIPWSIADDSQKIDIRNGILLCTNHHCLFDKGIIIVDKSYRISISEKIKIKTNSDKLTISSLSDKQIKLPTDEKLYPSSKYLEFQNNLFK